MWQSIKVKYHRNWQRYVASTLITFLSTFALFLLNGLMTFKDFGDITSNVLLGIITGAVFAAFRSVVKLLIEILQKRV